MTKTRKPATKPKHFPLGRELLGAGHLAQRAGVSVVDLETGLPTLDEALRERLRGAPREEYRSIVEEVATSNNTHTGELLDEVDAVEAELARRRPGFAFTAFQYLAVVVLAAWARALDDPTTYLAERQSITEAANDSGKHKTPFDAPSAELMRRIALWMATGSGKTLMGHVVWHLWSRRRRTRKGLGAATTVILVTPNERLTDQHIEEFTASGIPAVRYAERGSTTQAAVVVVEISKLRLRGSEAPQAADAVTVATDELVGGQRCLVLVDEAHKGGSSQDEKTWGRLRNELIDRHHGIEVEMSATLAEVAGRAASTVDTRRRYQHTIVFDYSYRRFHGDGYGKDYLVLNHSRAGASLLDDVDAARPEGPDAEMAVAAYLSLLEQRIAFAQNPTDAARMNLQSPLMLLLGTSVDLTKTADADVGKFLLVTNRLLTEPSWAREKIRRLVAGEGFMADAERLASRTSTGSPFPLLDRYGGDLYDALCEKVFGGHGRLQLHEVLASPGEIALSSAGAKPGSYFGAVWVGSATDVTKSIVRPLTERTEGLGASAIAAGTPERLLRSVAGRAKTDPTLCVLVGAKMFAEGWSSYRVATLGLLNVGATKGAQIMQLFGRGVRILGEKRDLRRSDSAVSWVRTLETVRVFGHGANHLSEALSNEHKESGTPERKPIGRLPVRRAGGGTLPHLHLPLWGKREPTCTRLADLPSDFVLHLDLSDGNGRQSLRSRGGKPLPSGTVDVLGTGWLRTVAHRARKLERLQHLLVDDQTLRTLVEVHLRLTPPAGVSLPVAAAACDFEQTRLLRRWTEHLITAALKSHTKRVDALRRDQAISLEVISNRHSNLDPGGDGGYEVATIYGNVAKLTATLEKLKSVILGGEAPLEQAVQRSLPSSELAAFPVMFAEEHLYQPIAKTSEKSNGAVIGPDGVVLTSTEPSVLDALLREWRSRGRDHQAPAADVPAWQDLQLYVLRNKVASGVAIPGHRDFYPDFLLWLVHEPTHRQVLGFVDPKGLRFLGADDPRLRLNERLRQLPTESVFPMRSYLVTQTRPEEMFGGESFESIDPGDLAEKLRGYGIFHAPNGQFSAVVGELLDDLRSCFAGMVDGSGNCAAQGSGPVQLALETQ